MSFGKWFIKSLYDRRVIAYSRFRPATSTIWHVLFVIFLAIIPFLITMNSTVIHGVGYLEKTFSTELPQFKITNGSLHWEYDEPFVTTNASGHAVVIDPTPTYPKEKLVRLGNGFALLAHELVIVNNGHIQSVPYAIVGVSELTNEQLFDRIIDLKGFLPILLIIASIIVYLMLAGVIFLCITIIAFPCIVLRGARKNLYYRHIWLMTAHALTLPVIILYWLDTLVISIPFTIFLVATIVILFIAIRSIPLPRKRASK